MRLPDVLRSPAPMHAFGLTERAFYYACLNRRRDTLIRVERAEVDAPWFQLGPVGLLHIERQLVAGALAELARRLEKPATSASLVVPNAWVRSVVMEAGPLPRGRQEAEDVLRWRLKKLLPCRPEEVRLDYVASNGSGRVLVLLGLDRPFAVVEEIFAGAGVAVGRIEPSFLALTRTLPRSAGPVMLVTLGPGALALALAVDGTVHLVRHKPLPGEERPADALVTRELARTLAHVRAEGWVGDRLLMVLACQDASLAETVESWALGEVGVTLQAQTGLPPGASEAAGFGPVELWSLLAVAQGGVA
jgi:hypothetical protein